MTTTSPCPSAAAAADANALLPQIASGSSAYRSMRWSRRYASALFGMLAAIGSTGAADLVPVSDVEHEYVKPHQLVDVGGGRRMNLFCLGEGSPTVVFDAGLSDWSSTWALIQPAVAKATRACSYDRPGMGYSDPSPEPRSPQAAVNDLNTLLERGGVTDRIVLVGHSLGGFYAKLFAVVHPEKVAGLVLVDPAEERMWTRVEPHLVRRFGRASVRAASREDEDGMAAAIGHFRDCARWARAGELTEETYKKCTDPVRLPLGATILKERRMLQETAAYQDTQASEIAQSMYATNPEADRRYRRLFAGRTPLESLPLVVLTHGIYDLSDPTGEVHYWSWRKAHELTASLSRRGKHAMVANARHNIQIDRPDAVVDAVLEVLAMSDRRDRRRAGLR